MAAYQLGAAKIHKGLSTRTRLLKSRAASDRDVIAFSPVLNESIGQPEPVTCTSG